jgi:hypothetical protein
MADDVCAAVVALPSTDLPSGLAPLLGRKTIGSLSLKGASFWLFVTERLREVQANATAVYHGAGGRVQPSFGAA